MLDPYIYEDVPVLKNKFGIKDYALLKECESDIAGLNLHTVDLCLKTGKINFNYLKEIHKYIFGDIYEWAGETRSISMAKAEQVLGGDSIRYATPEEIEKSVINVIDKMDIIDWKALNLDEKAKHFSKNISALWKVHPFREGNTRTVITFAIHYAEKHGFHLERDLFMQNNKYTRNSLVKASDGMYAENKYFERIIKESIELGYKNNCINEIINAGYIPTDKLVTGMLLVNEHFKKEHSVKDVLDIYKNIKEVDSEAADKIKSLAYEFQKEERKQNSIRTENYPDI